MSGLVTAGVLLCGLPHAMAESVPQNNETYYSVNVPSEISLSPDQDETTFTVSGNTYQKRWLDIDITSKNNFNLKNGQASIPYKLDKTKFEYEPQYVDKDSDSFSESIKVSKNEADVKYSGNYQDQLQFTMNPIETRTIQLDCNGGTVNGKDKVVYTVKNGSSYGQLPVPVRSGYRFAAWKDDKGNTIYSGSTVEPDTEYLTAQWEINRSVYFSTYIDNSPNEYFLNIGTFDVYKNGKSISETTNTLYGSGIAGDVFEIRNFQIKPIFKYIGLRNTIIPNGVTINTDSAGNLVSISIVVQKDRDTGFTLNFKSQSTLQPLIESTNSNAIIFDADKPSSMDNLETIKDMFTTEAYSYTKDGQLHLYNPNGGKLIAKSDSSHLFEYTHIKKIDANNLDTSNVLNTDYMFSGCTDLEEIDISKWNTSSLKRSNGMFYNCKSVSTLNINNWDMRSVTSIRGMFSYCTGIQDIDLSLWDTSNIQDFSNLFFNCSKLKNLDLHTWNTMSLKECSWTFRCCYNLESIDLTGWNTSNVININRMFGECIKLTDIKGLNSFDTRNIKLMEVVFAGDTALESLDLSSFDTCNCVNMNRMFEICNNLKTIYVSDKFVTTNVYNSNQMFSGCTSLIGGAGTKFDPTFIDSTGARIDGGPSNPGYFTAISDKPLETPQTNSETTANEVKSVETPVKEPNELETDSKQNESESQQ